MSTSAPWQLDAADVAAGLDVDPSGGLAPAEARTRLTVVGPNRLAEAPPRPWWRTLVAQAASPLNLVLLIAAALAGVVERSFKEALIIGLVLLLNGVLGFVQEHRADRAVAALRGMLSPTATVRRAGEIIDVSAADLVPGDVVLVEAGDRVPADGRVLSQVQLESDESGLTGESLPVAKTAAPVADDVALSDRTSMLHKFVRFQVTTNVAAILTTVTGSLLFAGTGVFNPLMLLWVNVIADGPPALALGLEPSRRSVMREPPRRRGAHILSVRRLGRIVLSALVMVAGTLVVYRYGLDRDMAVAQTLAFSTFVVFQLFNILNVRDARDSAFGPMLVRNWRLWVAMGAVLVLQICAVHVPAAQSVFGTAALTGTDWLIAAAVASSVLWVEELGKAAFRHRR